jgi:hypothetical protein
MKIIANIAGMALLCALLLPAQGGGVRAKASGFPQELEKPGAVERAALARVDFLVGDWEGEGWSLTRSGQRNKFWVKEFYRYRGNKDLMDMEGRFGDILPDGSRSAEREYDLGILFFDRESQEYRMWHYSSDGTVFTVKIAFDMKARSAQYTKEYAPGELGKFSLAVGDDGVWVTTFEILRPDKTWLQAMEFRMKRVKE